MSGRNPQRPLGPGTLYVYRWMGKPVFVRLKVAPGPRPACPVLFDDVMEIPVVEAGHRPLGVRTRRIPLVADWLLDVTESE